MGRARELANLFSGGSADINVKTSDGGILNLQTSDTTVTQDSVLGSIQFQAPDEADGTDAILVASKIEAVAEGTFSASSNATSLVFSTASSAAAGTVAGKMTFTSGGELVIKDTDTADGSSPTITLQSGDTDIAQDDVLGSINFQAPDEGTGTDAILVAAGISAISEGDFSSSSNATKLSFKTGASEAAAEKMSLGSGGDLSIVTDGASIFFGADSEIELRHVADDGLILKHVGTGDGKEPSLTFQAGDNDIAVDDLLGSIQFQAPDEGAGSDAVLVAAAISAVSEGDFSSTSNATGLRFQTGASETATTKMKLSSTGALITQPAAGGHAVFNEDSVDADFRVESNGNTHMLFVDGGNDALAVGTSSADTNATMTVSNTGDNHAISIVGALNKSRMHFQGANTGSASTDGLVIGLSSSDDTNDDSALIGLKESGSLTLQTNNTNHLIIDGNGHVTMPKQSCFHVKGSRQNNVPKNATTDIQFNSERFDLNGDFDTSTYTFTAPVTGKYQINIVLRYDNGDMDNSYYSLYLNTSNANYRPCIHTQLSWDQDPDYFNMNGALVIDMDANDTAKVQLGIPNLGADQVDLELPESVFSGFLVA
jgi:hypothetical protein